MRKPKYKKYKARNFKAWLSTKEKFKILSDRRYVVYTIIAVILVSALFIITHWYLNLPEPPEPIEVSATTTAVVTSTTTAVTTSESSDLPERLMYVRYSAKLYDDKSFQAVPVTSLEASAVVKLRKIDSGWCEVEHDGVKGWMAAENLREYDPQKHIDFGLEYYYQDVVREVLELLELDIDEYLVYGMMYTESRFNPLTTSWAGACGIMQIMPETWKYYFNELSKYYPEYGATLFNDMYNTRSSISVGLYVLKRMAQQEGVTVGEDLHRVLTCYNRGCGGAFKYYNENGTYETEYSHEILRASEFIRQNGRWEEGM